MNTMDLKKKYDLLKKNQEALKFDVKISEDDKGFILISTTVEERYKKALNKVLNDLILEALKIGLNLCDLRDVPTEEKEEYTNRWAQVFDRDKSTFVAILIADGIDAFYASVLGAAQKLNLSYFLQHVHPVSDNGSIVWKGPDGTYYHDGWKKQGDKNYQRNDPVIWTSLVS